MTVYVIKEQSFKSAAGTQVMDYSAAQQYGDVSFITQFDMPLHNGSPARQTWLENITSFVAKYIPESDHIICTGQPMTIFCIGAAMGAAGKSCRFLKWNSQSNTYSEIASPAFKREQA
jgi:hypothetical protein